MNGECDIEYPGFDDEKEKMEEKEMELELESSLMTGLELRSMEPRDLEEVKRLHEQCFPVRYDTAFYENVVRGFIVRGKGRQKESLYTQVAVLPLADASNKSRDYENDLLSQQNAAALAGKHQQSSAQQKIQSRNLSNVSDRKAEFSSSASSGLTFAGGAKVYPQKKNKMAAGAAASAVAGGDICEDIGDAISTTSYKGSMTTEESACTTNPCSNSSSRNSGGNGDFDWKRRRSNSESSSSSSSSSTNASGGGQPCGVRRRRRSLDQQQKQGVMDKNSRKSYDDDSDGRDCRHGGGGVNDYCGKGRHHDGEGSGRAWSSMSRCGDDDDGGQEGLDDGRRVGVKKEKIVGLITCQVLPLERCLDRHRLGLQRPLGGFGVGGHDGQAHTEVVYILTLGTETAYRRRTIDHAFSRRRSFVPIGAIFHGYWIFFKGIGRALLRRCVWLSRHEASIGAVYLHVITTNPPAHRFYEAEGFVQVCCIEDYYNINGELYDCFLYAFYVNGAQPPGEDDGWGIGSSISRSLLDVISFFRRTLGYVPEESKLAAAVNAAAGSSGSSGGGASPTAVSAASSENEDDDEEQSQELDRDGPAAAAAENRTDDRSEEDCSNSSFTESLRKRRQADLGAYSATAARCAVATAPFRNRDEEWQGSKEVERSGSRVAQNTLPRGRAFATSCTERFSSSYRAQRFTGCAPPGGAFIDRGEGAVVGTKAAHGEIMRANIVGLAGEHAIRKNDRLVVVDFKTISKDGHAFEGSSGGRGGGLWNSSTGLGSFGLLAASTRSKDGPSAARWDESSARASLWNAAASRNAWRAEGERVNTRDDVRLLHVDNDENEGCTGVIEVGGLASDVDLSTVTLDSGRCLEWEGGANNSI